MSWFPRPVGPRAAFADLRAFMRQRSREQVIGAALAVLVTIDHRHRIPRRFEDQHRAAAAGRLRRAVDGEPHRCRDHRRPEEGPGGERRRAQGAAAAVPEARETARNVSADAPASWPRRCALGEGARGRSAPNPNVGCVIVSAEGEIVGRGATAAGGRPHAEAVALEQAGKQGGRLDRLCDARALRARRARAARPAPTCSSRRKPARVVIALKDPDPRTSGKGIRRLRDAGIEVKLGVGREAARASRWPAGSPGWGSAGRASRSSWRCRSTARSPCPRARANGSPARTRARHVHLERAHSDMILVGRGTYLADAPRLDVRLPGLEDWSPRRALLTRGERGRRMGNLRTPQDVYRLHDVNDLLVEGGSATATAFLAADLVDRILIYRAPIIVGEGKSSFGYVGLDAIADAHGRWRPATAARSASTGSKFTSGCARPKRAPCSPASSPTSAPSSAPSSAATCGCTIRTGYDSRHGRPRRLDRLLGRVPDRRRQGRRLVRGRCFGRNRLADRRGPVARRRAAQPRALAAHGRRARRPYRHRPCRRVGEVVGRLPGRRFAADRRSRAGRAWRR